MVGEDIIIAVQEEGGHGKGKALVGTTHREGRRSQTKTDINKICFGIKAYSTVWYLGLNQKMMLLLILIVITYFTRFEVKRLLTVRCPLSVKRLRENYDSGPYWLESTRHPTYYTIPSWLRWPGGYLCGVQKQSFNQTRHALVTLVNLVWESNPQTLTMIVTLRPGSIIVRRTMTHRKSSAISGESTFQPTPCLYGNCAYVWFGTNHHLDAKYCFDFYQWGQRESRWY